MDKCSANSSVVVAGWVGVFWPVLCWGATACSQAFRGLGQEHILRGGAMSLSGDLRVYQ